MSDTNYGACVVLFPSPNGLPNTIEGGQHVTLTYLGDINLDETQELELLRLAGTLMNNYTGPIRLRTTGIERFGEDEDAVVVTFDTHPESPAVLLRQELISEFSIELTDKFRRHQKFPEFRPHMTLGYISEGYDPDSVTEAHLPEFINFEGMSVWNGSTRTNIRMRNNDEIAHYGILRRSGRYPWGSGSNPYQRSLAFYEAYNQLKAEGLSDVKIAELFGEQSTPKNPNFNTASLRRTRSLANDEKRAGDHAMILRLKDKGLSNKAIAERMKMPEATIRYNLKNTIDERVNITKTVAEELRKNISEDRYIDIGKGTENLMGISKDRLKTAVAILEDEGYQKFWVMQPQLGTTNETNVMILTPPGTSLPNDVKPNLERISTIDAHTSDRGKTFTRPGQPKSVDSKKLAMVYLEDGGADRDGLIEIRPGAKDLDLGHNRYAQVRIAVDDTHYLKGMAVYSDDLPPGVDIRFNTNKSKDVPVLGPKDNSILKPLKRDKDGNLDLDAPFGAMIKPGGQLGAVNMVNEQGDWAEWSTKLSSQMLSKQNVSLARQQLKLSLADKEAELKEISALTNPTVKKELLRAFSDNVDSQAVTLKAMGLPRTNNKVLIPFPEMKETEVYAPTYKDGEKVVLIRHPHGGVFEIPELTVNNRVPKAKKKLGNAVDAIGIHPRVAEQLSGADFDGDTVLVIPQKGGSQKIKVSKPLEGLKNFNPQEQYKGYPGMKVMKNTQTEMGMVSNLITDMTIRGANESEIAAAVRHSMVVIDAEKHQLNYKQSYIDNGIARLKKTYQPPNGGASTIISLAKSEVRVPEFKPRKAKDGGPINKVTGELMYEPTGKTYMKRKTNARTGEVTYVETPTLKKAHRMALTNDAHTLIRSSSPKPVEMIYADHANGLKSLANQARLEMINTVEPRKSPTAATAYATEAASLKAKLNTALKNAPIERQAQIVGGAIVKAKMEANPDMDADEIKKVRTRALEEARIRTGAKKQQVQITPKEWEAIQAHAISPTQLREILRHADLDVVKEYATPRPSTGMTPALLARAQAMMDRGIPQSDIADALGVSVSTITRALKK